MKTYLRVEWSWTIESIIEESKFIYLFVNLFNCNDKLLDKVSIWYISTNFFTYGAHCQD